MLRFFLFDIQFPSKAKPSIELQVLLLFNNALTIHMSSISIRILVNIVSGSFGYLVSILCVSVRAGQHGTRTTSFLQELLASPQAS